MQVVAQIGVAGPQRPCASGCPHPASRLRYFSSLRLRVTSVANLPSNHASSRRTSTRSPSVCAQQRVVGVGFFQVLADDVASPGSRGRYPRAESARSPRGSARVFRPALPDLLQRSSNGSRFSASSQPNLAAVWRERQMVKKAHPGVMASPRFDAPEQPPSRLREVESPPTAPGRSRAARPPRNLPVGAPAIGLR